MLQGFRNAPVDCLVRSWGYKCTTGEISHLSLIGTQGRCGVSRNFTGVYRVGRERHSPMGVSARSYLAEVRGSCGCSCRRVSGSVTSFACGHAGGRPSIGGSLRMLLNLLTSGLVPLAQAARSTIIAAHEGGASKEKVTDYLEFGVPVRPMPARASDEHNQISRRRLFQSPGCPFKAPKEESAAPSYPLSAVSRPSRRGSHAALSRAFQNR
jgi:hypothetical protein